MARILIHLHNRYSESYIIVSVCLITTRKNMNINVLLSETFEPREKREDIII